MFRFLISWLVVIVIFSILLSLFLLSLKERRRKLYKTKISFFLPSILSFLLILTGFFAYPYVFDFPILLQQKYEQLKGKVQDFRFYNEVKILGEYYKLSNLPSNLKKGSELNISYLPWSRSVIEVKVIK